MTLFKRYYLSLAGSVVLVVGVGLIFGLVAGIISVTSLIVGAFLGINFMATEIREEVARVEAENSEQPFPFF